MAKAAEKIEFDYSDDVEETPHCDPGNLVYNGDGTAGVQVWRYVHRKHTERDLLKPGYFDEARDSGFKKWDEITYTVGGPEPSDARRGIVVIEQMPGQRGVAADAKTTVSIVTRFGKATVAAHG